MDVQSTKKNAYEMFNHIAKTYDTLNSILSLGFHKSWRKTPLKWLEKDRPIHYLDLAAGTGEQLFAILDKMPNIQRAYAVDPAIKMLDVAKKKLEKKEYASKVDCVQASADSLPFHDESFDFSTITFGLRNLSNLKKGIQELHRVTKIAGQVHIIEFGKPHGFIKPFYSLYRKCYVPIIGKLLSKHDFAYSYLNESIEQFEENDQITRILFESGFESVFSESFCFGIVNHFIAIR